MPDLTSHLVSVRVRVRLRLRVRVRVRVRVSMSRDLVWSATLAEAQVT